MKVSGNAVAMAPMYSLQRSGWLSPSTPVTPNVSTVPMSSPSRNCGDTARITILSKPGWSRIDSSGPMTGKPLREKPHSSHSCSWGSRCEGSRPMLR